MATGYPEKPVPPPTTNKSGCPVAAILFGCAAVMLVVVVLCAGGGIYGYRYVIQKVDAFAAKFETEGYERVSGQAIDVTQSPENKPIYVCQVLTVSEEVNVDIAIAAQIAEIKADVHGDVDFFGQVLKIHEGVTIHGDVRVEMAQLVEIRGEVEGEVTGSYQILEYPKKASSQTAAPRTTGEKPDAAGQLSPSEAKTGVDQDSAPPPSVPAEAPAEKPAEEPPPNSQP